MPLQTSKYKKTRDGYLIDIEDLLKIRLPLVYWRLKIDHAFLLWDNLKRSGAAGFYYQAGGLGLPFIASEEKK